MIELRAPDPTLTAFAGDVVWLDGSRRPQVAHSLVCDEGERVPVWRSLATEAARWFAVPCRECFPAAPLPGWQPTARYVGDPDPHLAWQVAR
jgi:hypothetical protein